MNQGHEPNKAPRAGLWAQFFGQHAEGSLVRGSALTFGLQSSAAALGLLLHVALTWMLNSETQYGLYLLASTSVMIAAVPVVGGWDTVLVRYLAQYTSAAKREQAKSEAEPGSSQAGTGSQAEPQVLAQAQSMPTGREIVASVSVSAMAARALTIRSVAWLIVATLAGWWLLQTGRLPIGWTRTVQACVVACVPFVAWSMLRQGALRGRHRGAVSTIPDSIIRPLLTVAGVALVAVLGARVDAQVVMLSSVVAAAIAMLAGSLMLPIWLRVSLVPQVTESDSAFSRRHAAQWQHLAAASVLTGMSTVLIMRIDEWLLGWLVSPAEAGVYGPASRFAGLVVFGLNAVNPILGPLLAAHKDDAVQCQRLAKRGARLTVLISTPLTLALVFFPQLFLGTLPPAYAVGAIVLQILALAQWFNSMCGSVGTLLSMTGHHRDLARILMFAAALDVLLNLSLIPMYGALGAAIATALTIVAWNVMAWIMVRIRLGIDASAF